MNNTECTGSQTPPIVQPPSKIESLCSARNQVMELSYRIENLAIGLGAKEPASVVPCNEDPTNEGRSTIIKTLNKVPRDIQDYVDQAHMVLSEIEEQFR